MYFSNIKRKNRHSANQSTELGNNKTKSQAESDFVRNHAQVL